MKNVENSFSFLFCKASHLLLFWKCLSITLNKALIKAFFCLFPKVERKEIGSRPSFLFQTSNLKLKNSKMLWEGENEFD